MTVPDFQTLMLPLLKIAGDGQEHRLGEIIETLADQFHLSDEDRKEMLPSGKQAKFDNRVGWAKTHLKKAGLIESSGYGKFRITHTGTEVLKRNPSLINLRYLEQFPSFMEFRAIGRQSNRQDEDEKEVAKQTPDETLDSLYQSLNRDLAQELLERIKTCSPRFFENLVVDLLVAMGYGGSRKDAGQAVGKSGDGGIDGIIKEDRLGLDVVCIQAKRWEGTVSRPTVQAFAGSLDGQRAKKGVLITTSQFSQDAKDYVTRIEKKIVLIDGVQLAQLMIDHGVGVTEVATYTIKKADIDYFSEE